MTTDARNAGAIYDLGYQRYTGERRGRRYAFRTLLAFSFRSAFGIGRGEKSKTLPVLVTALVYMPALIQIGVASSSGMVNFISYANHLQFTSFLLALFAAAQAPELIVTDRQQGTLALYLSRPLRAVDYPMAKLAALTAAMLVLTLGPQLMLFLGRVFISDTPWPAFVAEWPKLFPIVGGTLLVSLFFAAIGLGLSSMASRRGYASAGVISFFLLTAAMLTAVISSEPAYADGCSSPTFVQAPTIRLAWPGSVSLDGNTAVRHFVVTNGATLRLINLNLIHGRSAGAIGGTNQSGNPGWGGSIYNAGGTLELVGCSFTNN